MKSVLSIVLLACVGCAQVSTSIHTMNRKERLANRAYGAAASQLADAFKELGDSNELLQREVLSGREDAFYAKYTDAGGKLSGLNASTLKEWVKQRDERQATITRMRHRVDSVYGSIKSTTAAFCQMQEDFQITEDSAENHEKDINSFTEKALSGLGGAVATWLSVGAPGI